MIALLYSGYVVGQQNERLDSLWSAYDDALSDSARINTLFAISNQYYRVKPQKDIEVNRQIAQICHAMIESGLDSKKEAQVARNQGAAYINIALNFEYFYLNDYDTALFYFHKALEIADKYDIPDIKAASVGNIGTVLEELGKPQEALEYFLIALEQSKKLGNEIYVATAYDNLGNIYKHIGDYPKSLESHLTALKLFEKLGDKHGVANVLNNISILYSSQDERKLAMEYLRKCLVIDLETKDPRAITGTYNNIGSLWHNSGNLDSARYYYNAALKLADSTQNIVLIATASQNLGALAMDEGDTQLADSLINHALKLRTEINDKVGVVKSLSKLGLLMKNESRTQEALQTLLKAYNLAYEVGLPVHIEETSNLLYQIYSELGEYELALKMFDTHITMRDSIKNDENSKAVLRQEYEYQYQKQAAADSIRTAEANKIKDAELETEKEENRRQKVVIYFVIAIVGVILFFVYMVWKSLKLLRIEKQKVDSAYEQLEEKNTEIVDSITYAKRIQSAILPPTKLVKEYLSNSFILYKPKDIVAGDFYWMEPTKDGVLFAAADCTGHGVPGAMVSVVCNNGLNRSVREYGLRDPGQILDKTREIVIAEFEKSEEEVKDGMDIALCSLSGNTLKYAGAHNPLWIIRKDGTEVEEIKANKQPIGKYDEPKPYTTHSLDLNSGDTIYLFSDGYADQFGGDKGKKFKAASFKRQLLSIQSKPMEHQRRLIDEAFENWKGEIEQLDDVCVIGVRI